MLYLHDNRFSSERVVQNVIHAPNIKHLTLYNNEIVNSPSYRHFVVNSCPSLIALDFNVVAEEERTTFFGESKRFKGMNKYTYFKLPDYIMHQTAEDHIFLLETEIYRLKRLSERNSPVIRIQSLFRGYRSRHHIKEKWAL